MGGVADAAVAAAGHVVLGHVLEVGVSVGALQPRDARDDALCRLGHVGEQRRCGRDARAQRAQRGARPAEATAVEVEAERAHLVEGRGRSVGGTWKAVEGRGRLEVEAERAHRHIDAHGRSGGLIGGRAGGDHLDAHEQQGGFVDAHGALVEHRVQVRRGGGARLLEVGRHLMREAISSNQQQSEAIRARLLEVGGHLAAVDEGNGGSQRDRGRVAAGRASAVGGANGSRRLSDGAARREALCRALRVPPPRLAVDDLLRRRAPLAARRRGRGRRRSAEVDGDAFETRGEGKVEGAHGNAAAELMQPQAERGLRRVGGGAPRRIGSADRIGEAPRLGLVVQRHRELAQPDRERDLPGGDQRRSAEISGDQWRSIA